MFRAFSVLVVSALAASFAVAAMLSGPAPNFTLQSRDGKTVWRFRDGKYANPVVADEDRIYITGQSHQYALAPRMHKRATQ